MAELELTKPLYALLPILLWATVRYSRDGFTFLAKMLSYDFLARTSRPLEGHEGSYLYYVIGMIDYRSVRVLLIMLLIGFHVQLKSKTQIPARYISYLVWGIIPLVLFSIAKTKLLRYAYPANIALIILGSISFACFLQMPKQNILKIILSISLMLITLYGIADQVKDFKNSINDSPVQTFMMQTMSRDGAYFGKTCYIDTNAWEQCDLLQAELSAGLHCSAGGIESFVQSDSDSLLLITDLQSSDITNLSEVTVLAQDEKCCLIGK